MVKSPQKSAKKSLSVQHHYQKKAENRYYKWGSRDDYLLHLSEVHKVSYKIILDIADALGEKEDFDGLIRILKHYWEEKP